MNDLISREDAKNYFCEHCDIRVLAQIDINYYETDFCPFCGAKMDGGVE